MQALVDDPRALVCVLIDEVESLAAARGRGGSSEPSDATRVVNAVLTQLDSIKRRKNVLILTSTRQSQAHFFIGLTLDWKTGSGGNFYLRRSLQV